MIPWSGEQRRRVAEVLAAHPAESNRCAKAARGVLPIATEIDVQAHGVVIEPPGSAVYVLAKGQPVRWLHHVTVAAVSHRVDALTGPDGHPRTTYLDTYFEHGNEHICRRIEESEWEVL